MNNLKNITGVKTDRPWKLSYGVGKDTEKEKYYQQILRLRNMWEGQERSNNVCEQMKRSN